MDRQTTIEQYGFDPDNYWFVMNFHYYKASIHNYYFVCVDDKEARSGREMCIHKKLFHNGLFENQRMCDLGYLEDIDYNKRVLQLDDSPLDRTDRSLMTTLKAYATHCLLVHNTGKFIAIKQEMYEMFFEGMRVDNYDYVFKDVVIP